MSLRNTRRHEIQLHNCAPICRIGVNLRKNKENTVFTTETQRHRIFIFITDDFIIKFCASESLWLKQSFPHSC